MAAGKDYIASVVSAPEAGGTQNVETSTTSGATQVALIAAVRKRYVRVQCISADDTDAVTFLFGDSTVEVDFATDKDGPVLHAGEYMDFWVGPGITHVVAEANANTPDLRITAVSPPSI